MFVFNFDSRLLYEGDSGGNGGGNNTPDAAFQRLLERNNSDGIALARQLFGENHEYRQEIRTLKAETDTLRGKAPAEGSTILSAEEAQAYEAYKTLGKPDELKQGLEQRDQLQGELESTRRETTLRTVAEAAGWKPSVLAQLDRMAKAQGKELAFEVREVEQDGQKTSVPYVKDGDAEKSLAEYAGTEWADFLPALSATAAQGGPSAGSGQATQQQGGTRFARQHAGSGGQAPAKDLAEQFLQEQNAKAAAVKNPLLRS